MAMIQCPECGQEISDKATTCPHCGTPIFVCPECGNVLSGQNKICDRCGYGMPKQEQKESDSASKDISSVINQWLHENPNEIKNNRIQGIIGHICFILALGLFAIGYFVLVRPWEKIANVTDPEELIKMYLSYESDIRNIWIIAFAGSCLFIIDALIDIYEKVWPIRCANWLSRQNIDLTKILKKESYDLLTSPDGISIECDFPVSDAEVRYLYCRALKKTNGYDLTGCLVVARPMFNTLFVISLIMFMFDRWCSAIKNTVISGEWHLFHETILSVLLSTWTIMILLMAIGRIVTFLLTKFNNNKITNYLTDQAR